MVCLPFEFSFNNGETAAVVHADYVCESEPESNSISKSTAIARGHCRMPMVGNNTVVSQLLAAGTSTLCISATVTKDVEKAPLPRIVRGKSPERCSYSRLLKRHRLS